MDLSNLKGKFSIKKTSEVNVEIPPITSRQPEKVTYIDHGFHQAGRLGGTVPGLRVSLQKLYVDFRQGVKDDNAKQEELKQPYRIKLEDCRSDIDRLERKITQIKTEHCPDIKGKIERLKEELSHIKKNPNEVTGDDAGKASFIIGGVILSFLTLYLFIFYSSASYSAFFKQFSLNEIGVANSIFDAKAFSKAISDGVTELALILTIPFVFLGLGYLIHKFQAQMHFTKYIKIGLLIFITFIFDSILGYEITEKIYNIKKDNSFDIIDNYTVAMALHDINFWLIIFAGFVVYIIWGFVFDFVMDSYSKMDKVAVAIKEKGQAIKDAESEFKTLQVEMDVMHHKIDDNNKEVKKLKAFVEGAIIPREFEQDIFGFLAGWMAWMKQSGKPHEQLDEADKLTHEFVKVTLHNLDTINA